LIGSKRQKVGMGLGWSDEEVMEAIGSKMIDVGINILV
jgi:hypothetical protein